MIDAMTCDMLVSHLSYHCTFVLKLWTDVKDWLSTLDIDIPLDLKVIERIRTYLIRDVGR